MDMGTVYNYIVISVGVVYLPGPQRTAPQMFFWVLLAPPGAK